MSIIRFNIANIANEAAWIGRNIVADKVRDSMYARVLSGANITADPDLLLSLDQADQVSDYLGASDAAKRGNVILEVDDSTTTDPERTLQIELIDVKVKLTESNTVVSTALVGRKGTIKEYIQADDYKVQISGNVISRIKNGFPVDEVITLRKILSRAGNIKVHSKYLQLWEITKLVYLNGNYDQGQNRFGNTQNFNLQFLSDDDYELSVED